MLMMYHQSMTNKVDDSPAAPWVAWPTISKAARENGWRLLPERGGVARMERRDPRSETGAVTLHIQFNRGGRIASAWIGELDRQVRNQPRKLDTILRWIAESAPVEYRDAGECANCGERIRETIGTNFRVFCHPDHGNHTVCDWHPDMESTDRVATPMTGLGILSGAIADRTGGRLRGEMNLDEIAAAFAGGPIHFRGGEVVTP